MALLLTKVAHPSKEQAWNVIEWATKATDTFYPRERRG